MGVLLEVRGLRTVFDTEGGTAPAVDGIDFAVDEGETVGIVGESGCGKTTLLKSIMGLLPVRSGSIIFDGVDLVGRRPEERAARGIVAGASIDKLPSRFLQMPIRARERVEVSASCGYRS